MVSYLVSINMSEGMAFLTFVLLFGLAQQLPLDGGVDSVAPSDRRKQIGA